MARKVVKVWYNPEGDYLEVIFEQKAGYFRETENNQVMETASMAGTSREGASKSPLGTRAAAIAKKAARTRWRSGE